MLSEDVAAVSAISAMQDAVTFPPQAPPPPDVAHDDDAAAQFSVKQEAEAMRGVHELLDSSELAELAQHAQQFNVVAHRPDDDYTSQAQQDFTTTLQSNDDFTSSQQSQDYSTTTSQQSQDFNTTTSQTSQDFTTTSQSEQLSSQSQELSHHQQEFSPQLTLKLESNPQDVSSQPEREISEQV